MVFFKVSYIWRVAIYWIQAAEQQIILRKLLLLIGVRNLSKFHHKSTKRRCSTLVWGIENRHRISEGPHGNTPGGSKETTEQINTDRQCYEKGGWVWILSSSFLGYISLGHFLDYSSLVFSCVKCNKTVRIVECMLGMYKVLGSSLAQGRGDHAKSHASIIIMDSMVHFYRELWVPKFINSVCVDLNNPCMLRTLSSFGIVLMFDLKWNKDWEERENKVGGRGLLMLANTIKIWKEGVRLQYDLFHGT
jgi:hypothetical protein